MAAQEELFRFVLDPSGLSEAEERRSLADRQTSILHTATQLGHVEMVRKLIVDYQLRGRSLDQFDSAQFGSSRTPLHLAAVHGHRMVARLLLTAGAEPDVADEDGVTPLLLAADLGHLPLVQLLSLHGAKRSPPGSKLGSAEFMGSHHNDVREWLQRTRSWCSPLHHLELLGVSQVRALLRSGAALHARSRSGAQSPLELARQRADGAREGWPNKEVLELMEDAARPWSPKTHHLWPNAARVHACELVRLGHRIGPFDAHALMDLWRDLVMPHVLVREDFELDAAAASRGATAADGAGWFSLSVQPEGHEASSVVRLPIRV